MDQSNRVTKYLSKNLSNVTKDVFIAPPLKIRFSVPVERVETTIFNPRVESRCFIPLHSYRQSDSQKSCYEKSYTLLETKHSESISCDCSPRFTRAANFALMQSLCFAPCNVIYYIIPIYIYIYIYIYTTVAYLHFKQTLHFLHCSTRPHGTLKRFVWGSFPATRVAHDHIIYKVRSKIETTGALFW